MNPSRTAQFEDVPELVAVIRGTRTEETDMTNSFSSGDLDLHSVSAALCHELQVTEATVRSQDRRQNTKGLQFNDMTQYGDERLIMEENAATFCIQVHAQLSTLQGRIDSLKRIIGTTCHLLQERLNELRRKNEATAEAVTEARGSMEVWLSQWRFEAKAEVDQWIQNHEAARLDERARMAHDCAVLAIGLAENSIDDAERMILEAVAMRRDAEAAGAGY